MITIRVEIEGFGGKNDGRTLASIQTFADMEQITPEGLKALWDTVCDLICGRMFMKKGGR